MADNLTSVSARQSAYLTKKLLSVAEYFDVYGGMGVAPIPRKDKIPAHSTKTAQWRRYEHLPTTPKVMVAGVTPDASQLTYTDVTVDLTQYGDYVIMDDVSIDIVEDPIISITGERQADQAMRIINQIREGILIAGTSVAYTAGSQRTDVTALVDKTIFAKAERSLSLNLARRLTKVLSATNGYNTTPIPKAYIAVASTWVKYDIEYTIGETNGFVPVHKYSKENPMHNEFGAIGRLRFIEHEEMQYFADGGGAKTAGHKSNLGVKEDVFATLMFGEEAYGVVMFGGYTGKDGIQGIVHPLGTAGSSDPLNQRASVGWKTMQACKRLNENWMYRVESGATA